MKKIRVIDVPAKPIKKELKVAAYCRVSTRYQNQKSSIETQINYYKNFIEVHPEWKCVGVFVDYGSRGNIRKRTEFQKMIELAMRGEIDYIITKSISRFSGNTVDMLQTIRKLQDKNVYVWFQKENITSEDNNIELAITLYTAVAQEEIRAMSENVKWGFQRKFEQGITLNNYKFFYGYDVVDGELVINEEQAKVVEDIFEWYLQGLSLGQIKQRLEEQQIKTASGKNVWSKSVIQGMLCNEKYAGDSMLQKYYTVDYLERKKVKNTGQKSRYYVTDSHIGIVSKEIYLKAQLEMMHRKNAIKDDKGKKIKQNRKYNANNVLGNILTCAECRSPYRRRTERGKVVYRCATRMDKGRVACSESVTVEEEWLKAELGRRVCGGEYDENVVREKVDEVLLGKNGKLIIEFN